MGAAVVPHNGLRWNNQAEALGPRGRNHIITCLIAGIHKATHKAANFEKLKEITQGPDENPAINLSRLMEALHKYTNLDPNSQEGLVLLHIHFISQSTPGILHKLQNLEEDPESPERDFLHLAFKVFNNRDEKQKL